MKQWQHVVVAPDASLRDAIACIDRSGLQLALVVDAEGRLLGVLSDGDVRRAILRGCELNVPAGTVMNAHPTTAPAATPAAELLALMRRRVLHHVPLVDEAGRVVDLATLDALTGMAERPNWVVLMAGGLGTRLGNLTVSCPKPMLPVGGKPILETIIEGFAEQGFRQIFLAVNYMAEVIEGYFGDGGRHGVTIRYLHEDRRLGTAGALSLLPAAPEHPLIVMNGDLLTRARFDRLLATHEEQGAAATMAIKEYDFQVPYGVVRMDGARIVSIEEKQVQRFFISAGIYALGPEALGLIPKGEYLDMPTLFEQCLAAGRQTCGHLLEEYWLDVGRLDDLERGQREWSRPGGRP